MNCKISKICLLATLLFLSYPIFGTINDIDSVEKRIQSYDISLRYSVLFPLGSQTLRLLKFESTSDFPPDGGQIEPTGAPAFTIGIRFRKFNTYFSTNYVNFKIIGETRTDLVFNETDTIPAGAETVSDIQMSLLSIIVTYRLKYWRNGSFGIGGGLILLPFKSSYRIEGLPESYDFQQLYPGPMITFHAEQQVKLFKFQLLTGFLGARINGNSIAYLNTDLSIKYTFLQAGKVNLEGILALKYIPFYMKIVNDPFVEYSLNANFFGPSLGLNVYFLR